MEIQREFAIPRGRIHRGALVDDVPLKSPVPPSARMFSSLLDKSAAGLFPPSAAPALLPSKSHVPTPESPMFVPETPMKPPSVSRLYHTSRLDFACKQLYDSSPPDTFQKGTPVSEPRLGNVDRLKRRIPATAPAIHRACTRSSFSQNAHLQAATCVVVTRSQARTSGCECSSVPSKTMGNDFMQKHFDVLGLVGQGSFGRVFKARCRVTGRLYAIKVSSRQLRTNAERVHSLKEVENYARLGQKGAHPNLVKYFHAWEAEGHLYIQTEFCDRGTFKSYLQFIKGPLDERRVWRFLVDIASGLKHIHDNNLIHLDLKPDNVFLIEEGFLKLGDYGISTQDHDQKDWFVGSPAYSAPEASEPQLGSITSAADIFSLGLVLLEMAAHVSIPSSGDMWTKLRNDDMPHLPTSRSDDLGRLIRKMMSRDPRKRPTVDAVLRTAHKHYPHKEGREFTPIGLPPAVHVRVMSRYWTPGPNTTRKPKGMSPQASPIFVKPRKLFRD